MLVEILKLIGLGLLGYIIGFFWTLGFLVYIKAGTWRNRG